MSLPRHYATKLNEFSVKPPSLWLVENLLGHSSTKSKFKPWPRNRGRFSTPLANTRSYFVATHFLLWKTNLNKTCHRQWVSVGNHHQHQIKTSSHTLKCFIRRMWTLSEKARRSQRSVQQHKSIDITHHKPCIHLFYCNKRETIWTLCRRCYHESQDCCILVTTYALSLELVLDCACDTTRGIMKSFKSVPDGRGLETKSI